MTERELVLDTMRRSGRLIAEDLQTRSGDMSGTEIHAEADYLPLFDEAVKVKNMLERPSGKLNGFVCYTKAGNAVRLIQAYDSDIYTTQPEELPAQWGFYWSTDPKKAKPFLKSAESPYYKDECCIFEDHVWSSTMDGANVHSPAEYPAGWLDLGTVEEIMAA